MDVYTASISAELEPAISSASIPIKDEINIFQDVGVDEIENRVTELYRKNIELATYKLVLID